MAGRTIEISRIPFIPDKQLLVDFLEDVLGNGSIRTCRLKRSRSHENTSTNCCEREGDIKVTAIVETESAESAKTLHNLAKARLLLFWCSVLAVKYVSCPDPDHSFRPDLNVHNVPSDTKICGYEHKSPIENLPLEPDAEQKSSIEGLQLEPDVEQKSVREDLLLEADVGQKSCLPLDAAVEQKSSKEDLPLKADGEQKNPIEDLPLEADFEQKSSIEGPDVEQKNPIEGLQLEAAVEKSSLGSFQFEADDVQKSAIEGLQLESDVQQEIDLPLETEVEQKSSIEGLPLEADVEQKNSVEHIPLEAHALVSKVAPTQSSEPRVSVLEVNEPKSGPKNFVPEMFKRPIIFSPKMRESKAVCEPEILSPLPKDMSNQRLERDEKLGSP